MNLVNELKAQYIVNPAGEKTAVLLPIKNFEEFLADVEDLIAIVERRDEPTISFEEIIENLKKNGLLQN